MKTCARLKSFYIPKKAKSRHASYRTFKLSGMKMHANAAGSATLALTTTRSTAKSTKTLRKSFLEPASRLSEIYTMSRVQMTRLTSWHHLQRCKDLRLKMAIIQNDQSAVAKSKCLPTARGLAKSAKPQGKRHAATPPALQRWKDL